MAEQAGTATAKGARVSRWQAWRAAADELPPPAHEVALAVMLGATMVALTNALTIALAVPLPPEGWGLRLRHHVVEFTLSLAVGAWLALPATLCAWLSLRFPRLVRGKAQNWGWLGYTLLCVAGMYGLLGGQLQRQANVLLDGVIAGGLYPLYVLLCGLAVPAAHVLASYLARVGWPRHVAWLLALATVVVDHSVLRDDYPELHAAVLWVTLCFFGAALADRVWPWLRQRGRARKLVLGAAALGLVVVLFPPSNAVRQQLFREPGAASSWALARTLWQPPALSEATVARPLPTGQLPAKVRADGLRGFAKEPIVIIVSVDALRGDVLEREDAAKRFPFLSRVRQRGVTFTKARSPGSQTSVSLTTMFSSRYFSQLYWQLHGVGSTRFMYPADDQSERFPSLLTKAGVDTHAFMGLIFLSDSFGIARGFSDEKVVVKGRGHAHVASVLGPMLKQLQQPNLGRQLYYAHVMEPHEPYNRGKLKKGSDYERYLSEVELVDSWIGKIVRVILRRHRRRAYLLVTADHGEAFGEHGTTFHTKTLYEELLHVPLTLWGPGLQPGRVDTRVSLVDVGPTVLHLMGQPTPPEYMGRSLLPLARGQQRQLPRVVAAEGRLRRAMYFGDLKVIEDSQRKTVEVYDLAADPYETRNLFDSDPQRAHPAVAAQRQFFERHRLKRDGYRPPFKP